MPLWLFDWKIGAPLEISSLADSVKLLKFAADKSARLRGTTAYASLSFQGNTVKAKGFEMDLAD
jgi:hypothetical protein